MTRLDPGENLLELEWLLGGSQHLMHEHSAGSTVDQRARRTRLCSILKDVRGARRACSRLLLHLHNRSFVGAGDGILCIKVRTFRAL